MYNKNTNMIHMPLQHAFLAPQVTSNSTLSSKVVQGSHIENLKDSPHKGPIMRNCGACHDVILFIQVLYSTYRFPIPPPALFDWVSGQGEDVLEGLVVHKITDDAVRFRIQALPEQQ